MQTFVYPNTDGFRVLEAEWNELLHDSAADTIFLTHQWQSIWWQHLGRGTLALIELRDDGGRLLGLAPLFRALAQQGQWELNLVGSVDVSDYLDIIVRKGHEERVLAAFMDLLGETDNPALTWDVIRLCNVPHNSPTLEHLVPMASARGLQATSEILEICPIVELPPSWEDYLARLAGKDRRELRRKLRRANPHAGVDWYLVGPEHDLSAEIEKFLQLMALSHPDKAEFLGDDHRAFIQAIARMCWEQEWLELAFLTVNGEPAATMFDLFYNNQTLLYNSGLDTARFLRMSPGIVLTALLIQHSIETGREVFDFLRGDESYKYQLGGVDRPVHQLVIHR